MSIIACLSSWKHTLFWLAGLGLIASFAWVKPIHAGDALDYHSMLLAWFDHGSPDLRAEDIASLVPFQARHGILSANPRQHYWPTDDGTYFCLHFWLYPLLALPAKTLLRLLGGDEFAALQIMNVVFYVLALYVTLFINQAIPSKRCMLAGIAAVSPVIWYLAWPSPEAFCWSCVLISLVLLGNRSYIGAALAAALASTQNPPVILLAFYAVVLSCRERRWRLALLTAAVTALSFLPCLFNCRYYGHLNLLAANGGTDFTLISLSRTWSFFTDFNQGVLPFLPLTLLLSLVAAYRICRARNVAAAGMLLIFGGMVLACETTIAWNSGAAGLVRYGVRMIPILAWFVVESLPAARITYALVTASVAIQAAIVSQHDGTMNFHYHNGLASFVLSKAPRLYSPEPEIFIERLGTYTSLVDLPVPFITKDFRVTKVLTDARSLRLLPERFLIEPAYYQAVLRRYHCRAGWFYIHPPKGMIKPLPTFSAADFQSYIQMKVVDVPLRVHSPRLPIQVMLANTGSFSLRPTGSSPPEHHPYGLVYFLWREKEEKPEQSGGTYLPQILHAGESIPASLDIPLPLGKGSYCVEVKPVLDKVAFGKDALRLTVMVETESPSDYLAEVVVH